MAKRIDAKKAAATRKTGASRRNTQKRLGKPSVLLPADTATPQAAEAWLYETGRSQLAAGRTLRVSADADGSAFDATAAMCRAHAAALKDRGVAPNLVAGAALIQKRLRATEANADTGAPLSLEVQRTAALVGALRESLHRLLHGTRNAAARKSFGLNVPLYPINAKNLLVACQGILDGAPKAQATEAAGLITASDLKSLQASMKAVRDGQDEAVQARKDGASQTTERDILTSALELFYDKYAAAIGLVLRDDAVARLEALSLVPRREERRSRVEEPGGGTGGEPQ